MTATSAATGTCTRCRTGIFAARAGEVGGERGSVQPVIVADKAVEPGDVVVKPARAGVVFLGGPVEAQAAALARRGGDPLDQGAADAAAAQPRIDKQILQVAHILRRPAMRMKQVVDDAGERRRGIADPGAKAVDRPGAANQPGPGEVIGLWRQAGLVEIEIAAPQLGPAL